MFLKNFINKTKPNPGMKTWVHASFSLLLAAVLYPIFNWEVSFILIGGVLIDADHYLWYILKHGNFNLQDCYRHFTTDAEKANYKYFAGEVLVFHTAEFFAIMLALSFYSQMIMLFTIGLAGHYLLDFIWFFFILKRFILNHSILWKLLKPKIQKV